ncbi:MAG: YggS family pyridoxal phosphate enzyme [bacterium]|nr:MAG: YggS family pyridoxal phosphate enzyme [bacterium]
MELLCTKALQKRISENLSEIRTNITRAAKRAGRSPDEVTIVAVTKTHGAASVRAAMENGIKVLGENRVQEARTKFKEIGGGVDWHFIGHLQKNKVKFLFDIFSLVHSVDSFELAAEINRRAAVDEVHILLQVNIGEESTKYGIKPLEVTDVAEKISRMPHVRIEGLMAIPPPAARPEDSRRYFRKLVEIKNEVEEMKLETVSMSKLSFGMTGDYEVAVEEGATHVRIGSGIFGRRDYENRVFSK